MFVRIIGDDGQGKSDERGGVAVGVILEDDTPQGSRKRKRRSIKRFGCAQCEAAFTREHDLRRHGQTVHTNKVNVICALSQLINITNIAGNEVW